MSKIETRVARLEAILLHAPVGTPKDEQVVEAMVRLLSARHGYESMNRRGMCRTWLRTVREAEGIVAGAPSGEAHDG